MKAYMSLVLVLSIFCLSIQSSYAKIALLPTIDVIEEVSVNDQREVVANFMTRPEVQKEMIKNGVNPAEALNRLAHLSNSEVQKLSEQIESAQAGADFGVGTIIGAALFVFIVLLITDILGFTSVFPFTHSIKN